MAMQKESEEWEQKSHYYAMSVPMQSAYFRVGRLVMMKMTTHHIEIPHGLDSNIGLMDPKRAAMVPGNREEKLVGVEEKGGSSSAVAMMKKLRPYFILLLEGGDTFIGPLMMQIIFNGEILRIIIIIAALGIGGVMMEKMKMILPLIVIILIRTWLLIGELLD